MYRVALLLFAITFTQSSSAESVYRNFSSQSLSVADFINPGSIYEQRIGKIVTRGNRTRNGLDTKPAILKNWQSVNSEQSMEFNLDSRAALSIASLRARERSDGWYEAVAKCEFILSIGGSRYICNAFVVRAHVQGNRIVERRVSSVISLPISSEKHRMTLRVEDSYEDAENNVKSVRVYFQVDSKASDFQDRTSYWGADANPLYGQIGGVGFMIQGFEGNGGFAQTAIYNYAAKYVPHYYGRYCYDRGVNPKRCSSTNTMKAFTMALPYEQLPGLSPIYAVVNPNLPTNIQAYYTQSFGEAVYLISLGYISYGSFGMAPPVSQCAGSNKEIIHRYQHASGRHLFSNVQNTLRTEAYSSSWVSHTSLACSLE